jgi:hypothetical protein
VHDRAAVRFSRSVPRMGFADGSQCTIGPRSDGRSSGRSG